MNIKWFQGRSVALLLASLTLALSSSANAQSPAIDLKLLPGQTQIDFTLGATLHTVHGTFRLKSADLHFSPATGGISGTVTADATSGKTDNDSRDAKMHRDVLESARYPDIIFRPDRVDGKVEPAGASDIQVHGRFEIHGGVHELTIPVHVEMAPDHWSTTAHFSIPYAEWGMKNPSTFVLHVASSVEISMSAHGNIAPITQ